MRGKKLWTALASLAMVFASGAAQVNAEPSTTSENTIDTTKTGSITLYKLKSKNGAAVDSTAQEMTVTEDGIPGVVFSYLKVGDIAQVDATVDGEVKSGVYYTISDDMKTFLTENGVMPKNADLTKDGANYYTSETMNALMKAINDEAGGATSLDEKVTALVKGSGTPMPQTDADGKTSAKSLALGLYLVAETDASGATTTSADGQEEGIAKTSRPFFVSLPMTNIAAIGNAAAGTVWQYDVTAYPKNEVVTIHKDIVADGNDAEDGANTNGLVSSTNKNVGDYVTFLLTSDAPVLQKKSNTADDVNGYREYVIKDTMSEGLTLDDKTGTNFKVSVGTEAYNKTNKDLAINTDYTVDYDDAAKLITITFTPTGLGKLGALTQDSKVFVKYAARLNEKAVTAAGKQGAIKSETNAATLTFGTNTSTSVTFKSNTNNKVYTYEMDLTKSFTGNVADKSAVSFSMQGEKADGSGNEDIVFIKESDGVYHVYDGKETGDQLKEINAAKDGKLIVKGLDARTYVITEENTVSGYNLMRDKVTLKFDDNYLHDGALDSASVASGSAAPVAITNGDLAKGIASFTIMNNETITALHTGGSGWNSALMIAGLGVLAAGLVLIASRRRTA